MTVSTKARLDPEKLYLLPMGIGNAFTSRFFNSSYLLFAGGHTVMIDAPAPLSRVLREAVERAGLSLTLQDIDSVLITHLHGDHCNGVEELGFWRRYVSPDGRKAHIYLLPELVEPLWKHRLYASLGPDQHETKDKDASLEAYFDVATISPEQPSNLGIDGLKVEAHYTQHFIPCIAVKVTWKGRTFGYSADTAFSPPLIDFLKPADVIVHETGEGSGHTQLDQLTGLSADIRQKLLLTHIVDDFDIDNSPIPVLEEGRLYEI